MRKIALLERETPGVVVEVRGNRLLVDREYVDLFNRLGCVLDMFVRQWNGTSMYRNTGWGHCIYLHLHYDIGRCYIARYESTETNSDVARYA